MKKFMLSFLLLSAATLSFGQNVPSYVPTNGLVGWWPFNGNANDESGNGNNGTVNGATLTTDRFGQVGKAYSFDGNADYIVIPNNNSLNPSSITISFWAFFNNGNCGVLSKSDATTNNNYGYSLIYNFQNQNTGLFTGWNTSGSCTYPTLNDGYTFGSANAIQNNLWQNIVVIIDSNGQCKQYTNGLLTHTYNHVPLNTCNSNLSLLHLGRQWLGDPCWMNGQLDDIGIWNRALTQQEITDLYNGNICYQTVSVTDTLFINTNITGFNPITYENTIRIWPNPTSDHITIDAGNLNVMNGYSVRIINSLGQQMFQTTISQQQYFLDLSTWTGNGMYFVHILDPNGNIIDIKKIVLR
jgi:hypothetical protein